MKELGYINNRLYTDVQSYHVFQDEESGKYYACKAEKKIDLSKCPFERGGFCGHFYGTEEAFRKAEPFDVGEAFEIKKRGEYFYYSTRKIVETIVCNADDTKTYTDQLEEGWYEVQSYTERAVIRRFGKTPTGRPMRTLARLGKLEKTCRYFYDHNF